MYVHDYCIMMLSCVLVSMEDFVKNIMFVCKHVRLIILHFYLYFQNAVETLV